MTADVPPPPVAACIQAADLTPQAKGATFFTVAGKSSEVAKFAAEISNRKAWTLAAQAESEGVKTITFRGAIEMPYREIGGLIFSAQSKRLAVTFTTYPAICEVENNAQKN